MCSPTYTTLTMAAKSNYFTITEDFVPSQFMVQTVKRLLTKTPIFQNQTCDEEIARTIKNILSWEPPEYMLKKFPYYLCGSNYDNGPVWMAEGGKFDLVDLFNQPAEVTQEIDKFQAQVALRILKSAEQKNGDINRAYVIADMNGLSFAQIGSRKVMAFAWKSAVNYGDLADFLLEQGFILNVNWVSETLLNFLRPILRRLLERVEVFRGERTKWFARLKSAFSSSVLPEYYGGTSDFQPIAVFGDVLQDSLIGATLWKDQETSS